MTRVIKPSDLSRYPPPHAMNTPLLVLAYNRPELTADLFRRLRYFKPRHLYFSVDGPKPDDQVDREKVLTTRQCVELVDWECEVSTNFSEINLGCRAGVEHGIDWFFRENSRGIILEDDCWPADNFFRFLEHMLDVYEDDRSIGHIAANRPTFLPPVGKAFLVNTPLIWGWATWANRWEAGRYSDIDPAKLDLPAVPVRGFHRRWSSLIQQVLESRIDTWDYLWAYRLWRQEAQSVLPPQNLVVNKGFGKDSTHTKNAPVEGFRIEGGPINFEAPTYSLCVERFIFLFIVGSNSRVVRLLVRIISRLKVTRFLYDYCAFMAVRP